MENLQSVVAIIIQEYAVEISLGLMLLILIGYAIFS